MPTWGPAGFEFVRVPFLLLMAVPNLIPTFYGGRAETANFRSNIFLGFAWRNRTPHFAGRWCPPPSPLVDSRVDQLRDLRAIRQQAEANQN